jgi:hypothetical protein
LTSEAPVPPDALEAMLIWAKMYPELPEGFGSKLSRHVVELGEKKWLVWRDGGTMKTLDITPPSWGSLPGVLPSPPLEPRTYREHWTGQNYFLRK